MRTSTKYHIAAIVFSWLSGFAVGVLVEHHFNVCVDDAALAAEERDDGE